MFESKTGPIHLQKVAGVASSTWYKANIPKQSVRVINEELPIASNKGATDSLAMEPPSPPTKVDKRTLNRGRPCTNSSLKLNGEFVSDDIVIASLTELRRRPEFINGGGYKKLTHYLKRIYGYHLNKKKVYRLCKENKLLLPSRKKSVVRRTPISINRVITEPLKLWELDIKYGYLERQKRFFFVMAIIDVYLRYIVGYHIGLRCLGSDLVRTLKLSMEKMELTDQDQVVIRMDNGPQMKSNKLFEFVGSNEDKLIHELIPVRTPNKDAHIESFYSILEAECFQVHRFHDFLDSYRVVNRFIDFYQNERVHSSLQYRTPEECYQEFRNGTLKGIKAVRL